MCIDIYIYNIYIYIYICASEISISGSDGGKMEGVGLLNPFTPTAHHGEGRFSFPSCAAPEVT